MFGLRHCLNLFQVSIFCLNFEVTSMFLSVNYLFIVLNLLQVCSVFICLNFEVTSIMFLSVNCLFIVLICFKFRSLCLNFEVRSIMFGPCIICSLS